MLVNWPMAFMILLSSVICESLPGDDVDVQVEEYDLTNDAEKQKHDQNDDVFISKTPKLMKLKRNVDRFLKSYVDNLKNVVKSI